MTKIAIPLFNERISPRFDCAQSFLLVETEDRGIVESEEVQIGLLSTMDKVGKLSDLRVDTFICGGIDEVSARRLVHKGIRIYAWITGMARDALISFLNGELEPGIMVGAGGHRQGRWRLSGKGSNRGEGRRKSGAGRGRGGGKGRSRNT
ncbi:MAG: hypothetical protein HN366_11380 [Deltaproteobacteria bacterium]|jgi:predicted Fe-Mo cluster-binding NifX family protein|nr:hypothetical protein [Deltaproteobacteria bacterium]